MCSYRPTPPAHAVPKRSVQDNRNTVTRYRRHDAILLFLAWALVSDHSKAGKVGMGRRNLQSELLLVSPDLSRSLVSALACFSNSGTRRRLELMNQLLICGPNDVSSFGSHTTIPHTDLSHRETGALAEHLLLFLRGIRMSEMFFEPLFQHVGDVPGKVASSLLWHLRSHVFRFELYGPAIAILILMAVVARGHVIAVRC